MNFIEEIKVLGTWLTDLALSIFHLKSAQRKTCLSIQKQYVSYVGNYLCYTDFIIMQVMVVIMFIIEWCSENMIEHLSVPLERQSFSVATSLVGLNGLDISTEAARITSDLAVEPSCFT